VWASPVALVAGRRGAIPPSSPHRQVGPAPRPGALPAGLQPAHVGLDHVRLPGHTLGPVVAGPLRGVVGLDSTLGHGVTQGLAGGPRLPLLCHCLVQIYIWLPSFSVTEPFYCNFFNLLPLPWLFLHLIPIILLLLLFLTVTQTVFTLFTFFR